MCREKTTTNTTKGENSLSGCDNSTELVRRLYRPLPFFGIDLILTWVPLWLLAAGITAGSGGNILLIIAGGSATLSAIYFVYLTGNRAFIRDFWVRAVDPTRISGSFWMIILFSQAAINLAAITLSVYWGGSVDQFNISKDFLNAPVGFILFILVFGPIPEELGWRGYGLDALRSRMNLLKASLLLGIVWGIWHLPMVFIEGSFQNQLLDHPGALISYFSAFFPGTILMSWIYYRTGRSTLSAIMFHFAGNFAGEIFHIAWSTRIIMAVLFAVFAVIVLIKEWPMFSQREFWLEFPETGRKRGSAPVFTNALKSSH
ncbi:MAG: CPBP family intramembrane metalloprotease [Spirochaetales bacterium]|nr:CPBP family intramembrane metalloprotease [Spirochaetales bacterium]MCF7938548.1 CPBP family intramembrane metalloprotease [Spirochaetales bacterium]